MTEAIATVEVLKAEVAPVVQRANNFMVVTPQEYASAAEFCKTIKGAQKRVVEFFAPMVKANLDATRATNAAKAQVLDPLIEAEGTIKTKQLAWSIAQERIRVAEEARLNAIEQERARKERETLLKKAAAIKSPEKAEALREQAQNVQINTVTVASIAPEVKGQSIRKTWRARVIDPKAAVTALMQFPDWAAYIEINQGQLDKFAARTKGAVKMAGVDMYEDTTLASTSK